MVFLEVRSLRYEKKYLALPCPLLALKFWRVCIDEAQMVEGDGTTKLMQMALKIDAVHRWCVSGTPVQRSVEGILCVSCHYFLFFIKREKEGERERKGEIVFQLHSKEGRINLLRLVCSRLFSILHFTSHSSLGCQVGINIISGGVKIHCRLQRDYYQMSF